MKFDGYWHDVTGPSASTAADLLGTQPVLSEQNASGSQSYSLAAVDGSPVNVMVSPAPDWNSDLDWVTTVNWVPGGSSAYPDDESRLLEHADNHVSNEPGRPLRTAGFTIKSVFSKETEVEFDGVSTAARYHQLSVDLNEDSDLGGVVFSTSELIITCVGKDILPSGLTFRTLHPNP